MQSIAQLIRTIGSLFKFAVQAWHILFFLFVAFISPRLWVPAFFTYQEWAWYSLMYAPFLTWASSRIMTIGGLTTNDWVMFCITGFQIYRTTVAWEQVVLATMQSGWAPYSAPLFALIMLTGGWTVILTTLMTLFCLVYDLWEARFMKQAKAEFMVKIKNKFFRRNASDVDTGTHGTASWMTKKEILERFSGGPFVCGVLSCNESEFDKSPVLRGKPQAHILVAAGTRAGKGVGLVVPNCLEWPGGLVVFDPQHENRYMTARHRAEVLHQKVRWIDPNDPDTHGVNILQFLDYKNPKYIHHVIQIVKCIFGEKKESGETGNSEFFTKSAEALIASFIAIYVAEAAIYGEPPVTLRDIAMLASKSQAQIQRWLKETHELRPAGFYGPNDVGIRSFGEGFVGAPKDTWGGVTMSVKTKMQWLATDEIARCVSSSTINPADIVNGDMTVYINIDIETMIAYPEFVRMILWAFLNAQMMAGREDKKVLYIIDEMPQLGPMGLLHSVAVQTGLKNGIILMGIVQDVATFQEKVGRESTYSWMGNTWARFYSAVSNQTSQEELSKTLGKKTVRQVNTSKSENSANALAAGLSASGESKSYSEVARDLLTADEVNCLSNKDWIVLLRGHKPILMGKLAFVDDDSDPKDLKFRQHPHFMPKSSDNPDGRGDPNPRFNLDKVTGKQIIPPMPAEALEVTIRRKEPHLYQPRVDRLDFASAVEGAAQ